MVVADLAHATLHVAAGDRRGDRSQSARMDIGGEVKLQGRNALCVGITALPLVPSTLAPELGPCRVQRAY